MFVHVYAENGEALVTGTNWMYEKLTWALMEDSGKRIEEFEIPPRTQIMRYNLKHFIRCLQNNQKPSCTATDGLNAQAIIEGIKKSIASGQAVNIQDL